MNKKNLLQLTIFFIFSLLVTTSIISCKKKDDIPAAPQSRLIKYEITGNYSGKFNIVFTNASGVAETLIAVALPWTKELTVQNSVQAVVLVASTSSTSTVGVLGQTATAKLYVGGEVKQTVDKTADATGSIVFNNLSFYY